MMEEKEKNKYLGKRGEKRGQVAHYLFYDFFGWLRRQKERGDGLASSITWPLTS